MYLAVAFLGRGLQIYPGSGMGPEFNCKADNRLLWVEAVAPGPGTGRRLCESASSAWGRLFRSPQSPGVSPGLAVNMIRAPGAKAAHIVGAVVEPSEEKDVRTARQSQRSSRTWTIPSVTRTGKVGTGS